MVVDLLFLESRTDLSGFIAHPDETALVANLLEPMPAETDHASGAERASVQIWFTGPSDPPVTAILFHKVNNYFARLGLANMNADQWARVRNGTFRPRRAMHPAVLRTDAGGVKEQNRDQKQ
ncbi:MAG: hypothetical protein AAB421_04800 [Patescibacteria group bacterium]